MERMIWINVFVNLLLLFIQFIPLNFKAKILYDVLKNKGNIQIKLFQLTLINLKISLQQGYIEIVFKSGKIKLLPLEISSQNGILSGTDIISLLIKKVKVQQGTIYVNFGVENDAYLTAMIVGISKISSSIIGTLIKSKKTESKIKNKIYPSFNKNKLTICFKASIKISIAQIIMCFIKALILKFKVKKEIENER